MKKTKRWLSGVLAALICCPSIFSSVQIARAAEIAKPEIKTSPVTENLEPEGAELYNSNLTTLPDMDTVKEELYGDEIKERYQYLPEEFREALPRFLTEWCFGDCYTRKAMDIQTRELLIFCILTALNASGQLYAHALGNIKVGNSLEVLYSALIQCLPYLGFPCIFNAFQAIKELA